MILAGNVWMLIGSNLPTSRILRTQPRHAQNPESYPANTCGQLMRMKSGVAEHHRYQWQHWLLAVLLAASTTGAGAAQEQNLPQFGDTTSAIISLSEERVLGQQFLRSLYAQAPRVEDPLMQSYLEHLIYRLASHSQLEDRRLDLVVIDDTALNAFAAPGGIIGVNLGLFLVG